LVNFLVSTSLNDPFVYSSVRVSFFHLSFISIMSVFELPRGWGVEPPNCFLNPLLNTVSNYALGVNYILHA